MENNDLINHLLPAFTQWFYGLSEAEQEEYYPADPSWLKYYLSHGESPKLNTCWVHFMVALSGHNELIPLEDALNLVREELMNESHYLTMILHNGTITDMLGGRELLLNKIVTIEEWDAVLLLRALTQKELMQHFIGSPNSHSEWRAALIEAVPLDELSSDWLCTDRTSGDPLSFEQVAEWDHWLCVVTGMIIDRDGTADDAGDWMKMLHILSPTAEQDQKGLANSAGITLLRDICRRRLQETVRRDSPFKRQ